MPAKKTVAAAQLSERRPAEAPRKVIVNIYSGPIKKAIYVMEQLTTVAELKRLRELEEQDPDWFAAQNLPAVQSWLRDWLASPLFIACMQKLAAPA